MRTSIIKVTLKGLCIGGTMLVPGVSGGTMAMLLGIYDRLIYAIGSFRQDIRGNIFFLWMFALGGLAGMFLFSRPILFLVEEYPKPSLCFFLGAVGGGIPMIIRHSGVRGVSLRGFFYVSAGVLIVVFLSKLPVGVFDVGSPEGFDYVLLIAAGVIAAVALVLPGISVSYMLLMLGLYDMTMVAISQLDIVKLLPLAVGLCAGILLTTKALEHAMIRHRQPVYMIILGFILGSAAELFPGMPSGVEWILCPVTLFAGFAAVLVLSRME